MVIDFKEKAKQLPTSPGVYLMKDSRGSIIYVGKSKSLKNRIGSYFQQSSNHSNKVKKLISHLKDFEIIQTDTEFEAFMLECKLIKQIQPLYNRLMKNPQSYTYIKIKMDPGVQRIELMHHIDEGELYRYFGPFTSKGRTEKAIQGLKEIFKMDCNQYSRKKVPCFNYSLGLCMGMCFDDSALEQYQHLIDQMINLLDGKNTEILDEMEQRMILAANRYDFEEAAKIRECIEAVQYLVKKEEVIQFTKDEKNILMIESIDHNRLKVFLIRRNKVLFHTIVEKDSMDFEQLETLLKVKVNEYFVIEPHSPKELEKDEIDEAQIIFHYLKSHASDSLIILESWLSPDNQNKLHQAINEFIKIRI